jgi:hypothetical protein
MSGSARFNVAIRRWSRKRRVGSYPGTGFELTAIESGRHKFIRLNYPNGDMVGHTGNLEATIQAVEAVDRAIGGLARAMDETHGALIITADHGKMILIHQKYTLKKLFNIDPRNTELYDSWLNILLWNKEYDELLRTTDIAVSNGYSNEYNILLKKLAAFKNKGDYTAAADLFTQLFASLILLPWSSAYLPYIMNRYKDNQSTITTIEQKNKKVMVISMLSLFLAIICGSFSSNYFLITSSLPHTIVHFLTQLFCS